MTGAAPRRSSADLPQVWRVPQWQPAALILIATLLLALDLYTRLSWGPLLMTLVIALACLAGAALAIRYLLVADTDGIWVRRLIHTSLVEWRDVSSVELVVGKRNAATVRVTRTDNTTVDVPPSLLLPTKPTSIRKVRAILYGVTDQLTALAVGKNAPLH